MVQTLTAGDETPQNPRPDLVVKVNSPAALLTVIPHLLGFIPQASLVVIGTAPPRDRVKVTLRYDLPDPPGVGIAAEIADHAVGVLRSQRLGAMMAVGYGPAILVDPIADALRGSAGMAGIGVGDILRAEDGRYWSYRCASEACCPAAGTPYANPADQASQADQASRADAMAALVRPGSPVLAGRAAVAAKVAPLGGAAAESMRQATRRAERHVSQLLGSVRRSSRLGAARQLVTAEGLNAVGAMIAAYRAGGAYTTDHQIARVTVALRDLRVRDDAWARMDPDYLDAHRRLWTEVTRRAQPGYVAAPASLLAFVAWQSGDGALANVALDRALADETRYSMALLLRQVITAGAPPSLARLPMTPEEVAESYDDAEADAAYADEDEDDADEDEDDYEVPGAYDHEPDLDVHHLDPLDEQ